MKGIGFKLLESMHQQKIQKMERINANLIVLSSGGHRPHSSSVPESTRQAKKAVELYRLIRDHAVGVLYTLKEKLDPLACPCHAPHDAGLRLEVRDLEMKPQLMKDSFEVRFRTYISVQDTSSGVNWREVDVEAVDANEDGAAAQALGSGTKQGLETTDAVFSEGRSTGTCKNNGTTTTGLGISPPTTDR